MKENIIIDTKRKLWKEANFQWHNLDGNSGGLMTLWDPYIMKIGNHPCIRTSNRFIHILIINIEKKIEFIIMNLYAPNNLVDKQSIFDLLSEDKKLFVNIPWIIM